MAEIPNLAGVATADLVEKIGGGNFSASYINWSRTLHLLRTHAPGWLPEMLPAANGGVVHEAPQGAFLLIRFRHVDGTVTPEVPQAIMDTRNAAIPMAKITARDITDTHRRGACMAAALTFGLAYELWAKMPLESGYAPEEAASETRPMPDKISPRGESWESIPPERQDFVRAVTATAREYLDNDDVAGALDYLARAGLGGAEEKTAAFDGLESYERAALKKARDGEADEAVNHLIRNRAKKRAA